MNINQILFSIKTNKVLLEDEGAQYFSLLHGFQSYQCCHNANKP